MEQKEYNYEYSWIQHKRNFYVNYLKIIWIIFSFIMGRAELIPGFYSFSLIYWSIFYNKPHLFILNSLAISTGLFVAGGVDNIDYIIGGLSGFFIYKFLKIFFDFKDSPGIAVAITFPYLLISLFLNYYQELMLYYNLIRILEASLLFLLIILLHKTADTFDESPVYIIFYKKIPALFLGLAFLLGVNSLFNWTRNLIEIAVISLIVISSFLINVQMGTFMASFYGFLLHLLGLIPQFSMFVFLIFAFVVGVIPSKKKISLVAGILISFFLSAGVIPTSYELKNTLIKTGIIIVLIAGIPLDIWKKLISPFRKKIIDVEQSFSQYDYRNFIRNRIKKLSMVFSELSTTFSEVLPLKKGDSKKKFRDFIYLFRHKNCLKCSRYAFCWENDPSRTEDKVIELLQIMEENKGVKDLPEKVIINNCPDFKKVKAGTSVAYELFQVNNFWHKRIREKQLIVSEQLQGISEIINNFSSNPALGINYNLVFKKIREKMLLNKLVVHNIGVYPDFNSEKINLYFSLEPCSGNEPCKYQLSDLIQSEFGKKIRLVERSCGSKLKDKPCHIRFGECGPYQLEVIIKQKCYQDECGDSL